MRLAIEIMMIVVIGALIAIAGGLALHEVFPGAAIGAAA